MSLLSGMPCLVAQTGLALSALLPAPIAAQVPGSIASTPPAVGPQFLSGSVQGDKGPLSDARLVLRVFGAADDQVWLSARGTGPDGAFNFAAEEVPPTVLAASSYTGRLIATAPGYAGDSMQVALIRRDSAFQAAPARMNFRLAPRDPSLLYALLLPAWVGLFMALLNVTTTAIPASGKLRVWRRYHPSVYAMVSALTWTGTTVWLTYAFAVRGQEFVPLGLGELGVPSILVIGAYLGSLTYVAYSIYVRGSEFFVEEMVDARRELLRSQAGRLLVAPYVAVIGYTLFAPSFPGLSSSPSALFFGFFTGLYIKVVLEALNGIGKRLLSGDTQQKIEERLRTVRRPAASQPQVVETGQEIRYRNGEREVVLPVDTSRVVLRFAASDPDAASIGQRFGLTLARHEPWDQYYVFRTGTTGPEQYRSLCHRLAEDSSIVRVGPVLGEGGINYDFPTDRVTFALVELPADDDVPSAVDQVLEQYRAVVQESDCGGLQARTEPQADPIALANALAGLPEVEYAEPDLVHVSEAQSPFVPRCRDSTDGALAFSLAKVPEAWTRTDRLPLNDVLIAVLDDGAELTHPDLAEALAGTFDAFRGELGAFPLPHDRHGTNCAGVAAARPAGDGMKGVGFGARLFVARVNYRAMADGDIITSSTRLRRGIDAALVAGADVLSLSWSAGESLAVHKAIERAVTRGRGGKGCVVVAAAGNDGGRVLFPAVLNSVIAVAGANAEHRLMRTETWSSNFGPEVDLTAPAIEMFTTEPGSDYTCVFQGTSAATALVAGAAAQVLRCNGDLTAKEVRDLLINTADLEHDTVNGRRVTLKLIDVNAAVRAARPLPRGHQ